MENLFHFDSYPDDGSERFDTLYQNSHTTIERIASNSFRMGEWYDQESDEWVVLLQGKATLEFEDGIKELIAGDTLFIKRHERHRVMETSADALWLAVHLNS